jgi:hypothetical protein
MSMYYRCYGYFRYENESEAKKNYDILVTREDNRFNYFPEELKLVGDTITFKVDGNFSSYTTCEKTNDIISEVAENAKVGIVKIDEGDGEDAMWSWRTYSVSGTEVMRTHTKPQKSYRFKGELEFADEEAARAACKMLLTDTANSIFTKFPPNQIVFVGDKRQIRFDGKFLRIDAHCGGNVAIFKKTERLLQKIQAQATGGNLEAAETFVLRFIPNRNKDSSDWVNNMNRKIFYHYTGSLTFGTTEEAENAYQKLISHEKSVFRVNAKNSFPLYVTHTKLVFDDIGNCHRTLLNDTEELIKEFAAIATKGKVENAFSNLETMNSYLVFRIVPSKVQAWNRFVEKRKGKQK